MKTFSLISLFCLFGISMLYASDGDDQSVDTDSTEYFVPLEEIIACVENMFKYETIGGIISIDELNDLKDIPARRKEGMSVLFWVKDDVTDCRTILICEEIYDGNYFCSDGSFYYGDMKGALIMVSANEIYQVVKGTTVIKR